MEITVARITPYKSDRSPTLRAFVSLQIYTPTCTFEVRDCKYHINDSGDWIQLPSRPYEDRETGEQRYTNTVHFPDKDEYAHFQNRGKHEIRKALDPGYADQMGAPAPQHSQGNGAAKLEVAKPVQAEAYEERDERGETFDDIPF